MFLMIMCLSLEMVYSSNGEAQGLLDKKVSLTVHNKPLETVLGLLQKKESIPFVYSSQVDLGKKISLSVREASLESVLDLILLPAGLRYEVIGGNVVIRKGNAAAAPFVTQSFIISGKVKDTETKEGLSGVSVVLKDGNTGTLTDAEGDYTLEIPDGRSNGVLQFSYLGYIKQEVPVAGQHTIDVELAKDVVALNNVVVIGYGTKKKENLTGSVASVGAEVLASRPVSNTISALQGEIPGLTIQRSSGQPGLGGFDLNVRGFSSTNGGNSPLVLIDGVAGNLDLLNPDDIASVTVLKDASASIYGARAANGVILVTTKKGKKGAPAISYSNSFAVTKMTGMMESPTNYEMAIMDNEANIHNGAAPMYTPALLEKIRNNDPNPIPHPLYGGWMLFFTNTNWIDAVLENGFQQKHNLNVSGGGNNSSYYLSGSYTDQRGVIKYADDNNKRYNLRLNYDYDFSDRIRLESQVALENQVRSDIGGLGAWVLTEATFGMPNHPVYTPDGKFFAQGGWGNAVAQAKEGATATYKTRNVNTNFKLIGNIANGLKLNLQAGINYQSENDRDIAKPVPLYNWDGKIAYYTIANPGEGSLTQYNAENSYRNFTAYFQYSKTFGRHDLDLMGGASHEENDLSWFNARRDNFVTDDLWSLNLGSTDNMSNDGGGEQWAISSLFSRLSYSFNHKYVLEANLRYDGSSRFEADTRWGLFPGVSLGWRLSEESFIKNLHWFDDLKLRASYGETGNQEGIGLYDYLQLINIGGAYPFGAGGQAQSASLAGMVSNNRTWETLVNKNIGIDAVLFSSRLDFSFDYFQKRNKDLLIPVTYPSVLGATAPYSNSGELKTWGFETSLAWKDKIGKLSYSVRLILSDAKNKIVDYGGADTYIVGLNHIREGYPVNTYFAYVFDGLIRTPKELADYKKLGGVPSDIGLGDAKFKDLNGDGKISPYSDTPGQDGDVVNVGNTTPRFNYGINLRAKFRNFDAAVFLQGVGKRTLFREGEYAMPWSDWWRQPPRFYYGKTWNEDRPDAKYPRLSHGSIRYWNYQPSTLQQINAAYIRLKNLQIGYSLPQHLIGKIALSEARIYVSGENIWEFHHVEGGWDPESSASGFNYPFQRFYSAGIDLTF